ncbi:signal protein [Comamonas aquatilis]|uniref:signal protein n=1 Tax=Comamonas aquatilis TaxID=1778406 RepID=UPI0039F02F13
MRNTWTLWLAAALMGSSLTSFAQTQAAPATAPAAKTAPAPAAKTPPAAAAMPATKAAPASAPAATGKPAAAATPAPAAKTAKTAAAGGGAGKVWANEDSKIYHCQGSRFYGTTKNGKYMTEAEAKAAGMHGANNKTCA